jgi:hypothetical protein
VNPIESLLASSRNRLNRLNPGQFVALATLFALASSIFFFSPKFWLMTHPVPGSFEWDRAFGFLRQCDSPFTADVEAAIRWRLLPPLVAHGLGLTGPGALSIPGIGLVALFGYWVIVATRHLGDRLDALLLTILLGTTGGVLTVTAWLGVNDAWFLLGLVAVAGGRGWRSLVAACLLAPWIDERFLLGWPLALYCRWWLQERPAGFSRVVLAGSAALLPYVGLRAGCTWLSGDNASQNFLHHAFADFPTYLPYVQLGWWMGFRLGWILVFFAFWGWWLTSGRTGFWMGVVCAAAGLLSVTLLASDLTRSTGLLVPLLLAGAVTIRRKFTPEVGSGCLAGCTVLNLAVPCVLVVHSKTVLLWSLPVELFRLSRSLP